VCIPPPAALHTWTQVFSRATMYLLVAGGVHALAVWGVCGVREEGTGRAGIWAVIWVAWVAVVWLPLIALLTAEHSVWVAVVLPVTAVFATLLLRWRAGRVEDFSESYEVVAGPFQLLESPPLWWVLLPAMLTSLAVQIGVAMLLAGHAWTAGCLFGAGAVYPVERWLNRPGMRGGEVRGRVWRRIAAGNSLTVWGLILLALIPFMAAYASGELSGLMGMPARIVPRPVVPSVAHSAASGYSSLILIQPRKPHEIVAPAPATTTMGSLKDTQVIAFDGAYWYFKQPDTQPAPGARVMQGDPIKRHVRSTDMEPLTMEAHQPLGRELAMSCCRALRVDVTNADAVPGAIAVEVLLRDTGFGKKTRAVSLGTLVLPTSTVSPMPLARPAVEDTVTFKLPHAARGASFNEITVRIKPERSRSLAGAHVAIKDFVLQP